MMKTELAPSNNRPLLENISRREFIDKSLSYYSALLFIPLVINCGGSGGSTRARDTSLISNLTNLGPLQDADENGCRLPAGFSCRVVANSLSPVIPGNDFNWHAAPDGGAALRTETVGFMFQIARCTVVAAVLLHLGLINQEP